MQNVSVLYTATSVCDLSGFTKAHVASCQQHCGGTGCHGLQLLCLMPLATLLGTCSRLLNDFLMRQQPSRTCSTRRHPLCSQSHSLNINLWRRTA